MKNDLESRLGISNSLLVNATMIGKFITYRKTEAKTYARMSIASNI